MITIVVCTCSSQVFTYIFSLQHVFFVFFLLLNVFFVISLSISPKKLFKKKFQVPKYLEIVFTCGNFG